jgi:hypothetical protein
LPATGQHVLGSASSVWAKKSRLDVFVARGLERADSRPEPGRRKFMKCWFLPSEHARSGNVLATTWCAARRTQKCCSRPSRSERIVGKREHKPLARTTSMPVACGCKTGNSSPRAAGAYFSSRPINLDPLRVCERSLIFGMSDARRPERASSGFRYGHWFGLLAIGSPHRTDKLPRSVRL